MSAKTTPPSPSLSPSPSLDVDSLLAEFANLKFTIQKGTATETNVGRARELHKILYTKHEFDKMDHAFPFLRKDQQATT